MNDPAYVEAAQALARRLVREGGDTPQTRARYGLRLALAREPEPREVQLLIELFRKRLAHYRVDRTAARQMATEPLGPLPEGWETSELAAWTAVCNVILNLDEFLTRG